MNLKHLEKLKDLDVDLDQYLISNLEKPDKLIKIVNDPLGTQKDNHANIHFHDASS